MEDWNYYRVYDDRNSDLLLCLIREFFFFFFFPAAILPFINRTIPRHIPTYLLEMMKIVTDEG